MTDANLSVTISKKTFGQLNTVLSPAQVIGGSTASSGSGVMIAVIVGIIILVVLVIASFQS